MRFIFRDLSIGEMKRLLSYRYVCTDHSLVQRLFMRRTLAAAQKLIPRWVLPNQITMAGFAAMLAGFILTFIFDPTLRAPPPLLTAGNASLLAFYFVADGVDGIHARGTNQTSPFGYILDHGVDSTVCVFLGTSLISALRLGISWTSLLLLTNIWVGFYLSALQHRFTGRFSFGYISGCSEGILTVVGIQVASLISEWPLKVLHGKVPVLGVFVTKRLISLLLSGSLGYSVGMFLVAVLWGMRKGKYPDLLKSLHVLLVILLIFAPAYLRETGPDPTRYWILMTTFGCIFTVCYTEETLSIVLGSFPDHRIFILGYSLLGFLALQLRLNAACNLTMLCTLGLAFAFFLLRLGSITRNICKRTGTCFLFGRSKMNR